MAWYERSTIGIVEMLIVFIGGLWGSEMLESVVIDD